MSTAMAVHHGAGDEPSRPARDGLTAATELLRLEPGRVEQRLLAPAGRSPRQPGEDVALLEKWGTTPSNTSHQQRLCRG